METSVFKYVDFFIPNEIELSQYSGKESLEESSARMLSLGVKNLIVTLGSNGSVFINNEKTFKVDAFKVKPVDTVAAGDTFVGYFSSALASGRDINESMVLGSKASSITVTRKGSIVSIPYGHECDL